MLENRFESNNFFKKQELKKRVVSPPENLNLENQTYFRYFVLNQVLSISKLMKSIGIQISLQGGCLCCFHLDENHQSGKIYLKTETKEEHLYCFSEHRSFRATDFLKDILGKNPYEEFDLVWPKIPEPVRIKLKQQFSLKRVEDSFSLCDNFHSLKELNPQQNYLNLLKHMEREIKFKEEKDNQKAVD